MRKPYFIVSNMSYILILLQKFLGSNTYNLQKKHIF